MSVKVYGLGGDALMAPEHTATAFWASIAGGSAGFISGVRLSKDGVVVCTNHDNFESTCGDDREVRNMTWDEIAQLDAGFTFQSTVLNNDNQPTGEHGEDKPWEGNLPKKEAIRVMNLSQVLILFARRSSVGILMPDGQDDLIDATIADLKKYGVLNRVVVYGSSSVCTSLMNKQTDANFVLVGGAGANPLDEYEKAIALKAKRLCLDWEDVCESSSGKVQFNPAFAQLLDHGNLSLDLNSREMQFAPTPDHFEAIRNVSNINGIIARGVLPTVEGVTPKALVASDDFSGKEIDKSAWSAGYSHINQDTVISQDDGIHINIKEGGSYSGAAAICLTPLHQRFDAEVEFSVSNPQQGTTFEMAAICIDPGYDHTDNSDLDTRSVNLTFDVHGAPPYASSERDEDDGFRCGWNNGFNLTKVDPDWVAASVNMYNKYGRDVGNGEQNNPTGTLRLVRHGSVFATYYKDKYNSAWVCSGTMLIQNMSEDVYLRLAGKHWAKGGNPCPGNNISFYNFKVYQF